MTYRDDLAALAARHAALDAEVGVKAREVEAAGEQLRRARLPVLDGIRVATPCTADWNQMVGDERVRACSLCNKNVYNLSSMTRAEAEAAILEREGRLCVRYYQRADGTILLRDCEIGVKRRRRRKVIAVAAASLLAGAGGVAYEVAARPGLVAMGATTQIDPQFQVAQGGAAVPMPLPEKGSR